MPFALPTSRRKGLVLRAALAATVLAGVGLALPSSAADAYTAEGFLEVPTPLSPGDTAFDLATCPELPPTQGVDVYVFDLPAAAAVEGAATTVTGTDAAGPVDLYAYVYKADCTYDRTVQAASPEVGLVFPLEAGDRFVSVGTPTGLGTALALSVAEGAAPQPTLPPTPTAEPSTGTGTGGSGAVVRRDYSGGVDDPLYPETGTGPASLEFSGQWGMRLVQAEQAWQEQRATGAGITVAVLDSGLDVTHPDFACEGKVVRLDAARYPRFADVTDTDGHGTHVAGTVGACTDNGEGVVGVAPDSRILPVQALSPTEATAERLAAAIDAATESGAHVINMSLGFSAAGLPATGSAFALAGQFAEVDAAVERAVAAGVVVVAAAGNESVPLCGYPAIAADVVCVGSTDRRDLNAWYGNFPVTPDGTALVAPGGSGTATQLFCDGASEGVLSTYSRDAEFPCDTFPGYIAIDGTSMATPHVAGVAALVYDRLGGVRSAAAAQTVIDAMASTAKDLYTPGYDPTSGEGRVDALAAVLSVPPAQVDPSPTGTPTPTADPQAGTQTELVARATGQTTDALSVAAQVADEAGRPLADVPVDLVLTGEGGSRSVTATTDGSGTASTELPLDLAPGDYALSATVASTGGRTGSSDSQPFSVLQDDSALLVSSSGNGSGTRVTAVLTDADGSAGALADRTVVLLADGAEAGTAVTDASGTAVFAPQGRNRNARSFEVRYAGDALFLPSSASTPGR